MEHLYGLMDHDTAALILQLQRDDLEMAMSSMQEHGTDSSTDDNVALKLQLHELELIQEFRADRTMARSQAIAMVADKRLLVQEMAAEQQVNDDRALARQLDQNENMVVSVMQRASTNADEEILVRQEARICASIVDQDAGKQLVLYNGGLPPPADEMMHDGQEQHSVLVCDVCSEELPWFDLLTAPCGHAYCASCLSALFETCMTDETMFPPRCCRQPIPADRARLVLHPKLFQNFTDKSVELESTNRTYCSDSHCSCFIPDEFIRNDVATCHTCGVRTCTICKADVHANDCPRDETLHQFLQAANRMGFQRCYRCRRVVELRTGCNHVTCPCGAQFCFVCGSSWQPRSCQCPQVDETMLLEGGVQVRPRNPLYRFFQPPDAPQTPAGPSTALAIIEHQHDPVNSNECAHGSWVRVAGPHQCHQCRGHLREFILTCRRCNVYACLRCIREEL